MGTIQNWVIVNRITKSANFLTIHVDYEMEKFWQVLRKALGTHFDARAVYHSRTEGRSERTFQTFKNILKLCY